MKIGIDIDGTLTDFSEFIVNNSQEYMWKKYSCKLKNLHGYDIDEVYNLKDEFLRRGWSEPEVQQKVQTIVREYWNKYYLKYCFVLSLRKGAGKCIRELRKKGHEIIILSSRDRSCGRGIVNWLVRVSTKIQLVKGGVHVNKILFFTNDEAKKQFAHTRGIDYMVDDKPDIAYDLATRGISVFLVDSNYNKTVNGENIIRIHSWKEILEYF